jgi:hypothetical protein
MVAFACVWNAPTDNTTIIANGSKLPRNIPAILIFPPQILRPALQSQLQFHRTCPTNQLKRAQNSQL